MKNIKKTLVLLMSMIMVFSMIPAIGFAGVSKTVQELPERVFSDAWTSYDVIYRTAGTDYTYKGEPVVFESDSKIKVGDKEYEKKSQEVTADVAKDGSNYTVTVKPISAPVGGIPGEWNSNYRGKFGGFYSVDNRISSSGILEGTYDWKAKSLTFKVENLPEGKFILSNGQFLEGANQYSPGHDFGDGKGTVTERSFGLLPDVVLDNENSTTDPAPAPDPDQYLGVNVGSDVPESYQNNIWTQYDFKELKVGEEAKLVPRRVPEGITDPIANNVKLPEFNYKIIYGDSITIDDENNAIAKVKAVKPGNTVVEITYDEMENNGHNFPASDPINTAYVIYSVGGDDAITITDNIDTNLELKGEDAKTPEGMVSLTSYDTLYFDKGETLPFDLKVKTEGADKLVVKVNGITVDFDEAKECYVLPLENRNNIVEMKATARDGKSRSLFRVIKARKVDIDVQNVTNDGEPLRVGDKASITFKGLTIPVYKLATIYNPQFGKNVVRVQYLMNGETKVEGLGTQWDISNKNQITVNLTKAGEYSFTDGCIVEHWWGKPLGSDKLQDDKDDHPYFGAPVVGGTFDRLPDFSFNVEEKIPVEELIFDKTEFNLETGNSADIKWEVKPENATQKEVKFESDNEEVAKVDGKGHITAVGAGKAEITGTVDGKTAKATVTVTNPEVSEVIVSENELDLYAGQSMTVTAEVKPDNLSAEQKKVVWESSNPSVATVKDGVIKGIKPGKAVVKAVSEEDPKVSAQIDVLVVEPVVNSITVRPQAITVKAGEISTAGVKIRPVMILDSVKPVVTSEDSDIATGEIEGNQLKVYGVKEGKTDLTVSLGNKKATVKVTVEKGMDLVASAKTDKDFYKPGEKVTVTFENLKNPEKVEGQRIWSEYVMYKSSIPGLNEINGDSLETLTFDLPEDVERGVYYLTSGKLHIHYGGVKAQGMFLIGDKTEDFYVGQMPVIKVVVGEEETVPAKDGWEKEDGKWYFYEKGEKKTGWVKDNNHWYHMDEEGVMDTGWLKDNDHWYFLNPGGSMKTGWHEIDGKYYFFYPGGSMAADEIVDGWYVGKSGAWVTGDWHKNSTGWWYGKGDGSYPRNGFVKIGSGTFKFDKNGYMETGWVKSGGKWYYMNQAGYMQHDGWQKIGKTWYYFYGDGHMAADETIDGWFLNGSGAGSKIA